MSNMRDETQAVGGRQVVGMILLSMGLYAMVLGWTVPLALLSWPGALENDASLGTVFLGLGLLVFGMLLLLASLLCLQVHWLLVLGLIVLSLVALFVRDRLFPAADPFLVTNGILLFGAGALLLSSILLGSVQGIWPALWRTLLVTGVSASIIYGVASICAQVAAASPRPSFGQPPSASPVYPLASVLVGSVDLLLIAFWLTRKGRESSLEG
jgi:hypothetical protein